MISVGIDVSKDKHDCCILGPDGKALLEPFTITNSRDGFEALLNKIRSCSKPEDTIKVGFEATGHYHLNLLGFILVNDLTTIVLNPLQTSQFRKGITLRKTKTDRVDAHLIASLLLSNPDLKPYTPKSYHIEELKSLARYRFDLVQKRAEYKQTLSRLCQILFPELEKHVSTLNMETVYSLLEELPGAEQIAKCSPDHLCKIIKKSSRSRFDQTKADEICNAAKESIGLHRPAESLQLTHTIYSIRELNAQIKEVDAQTGSVLSKLDFQITSIPGIGFSTAALIIGEIGDFSRFDSPDKLLAFAGFSPSTNNSGQKKGPSHVEKRGSHYLRYALFIAARGVWLHNPTFAAYLKKKMAEGKHYYVAMTHVVKKLVRLIFALEKSKQPYRRAA